MLEPLLLLKFVGLLLDSRAVLDLKKQGFMRNFIPYIIILFPIILKGQEFRGIDFRMDIGTNDTFGFFRRLTIELYFKSQDTIQLDTLKNVACFGWEHFPKTTHLYLNNSTQLLRFQKDIHVNLGGNSCTVDTIYIEGITNYNNGALTPIQFSTYYFLYPYTAEDPIYNSLQTDAFFEDGVFYFDASGVDPNGQNLGCLLLTNLPLDFDQYYTLPVGTDTIRLDTFTCTLLWDRPTIPGKYLVSIGYTQSFSSAPPHIAATKNERHMIIEVKEEDIVSFGKEVEKDGSKFALFPIPATSSISISAENIPTLATLTAHNLLGQPILQRALLPAGGDIYETVDVSTWPPGVYFFTLRAGGQVWSEKAVIRE